MLILQVTIVCILGYIVYQDFKYRGIYWFCFPTLSILLGTMKVIDFGFYMLWTDAIIVISFLFLQFFCLWCYFAIKHRKLIDLTKGFIGWGDILFFIVLCFYFSPLDYIIFYIFSLFSALIFAFSANIILNKQSFTIPLAGIQAFLFSWFLIGEWYLGWQTDSWIKI